MLRTLIAVLLLTSSVHAQSPSGESLSRSVEALVDFETKANAVAVRSNDLVRIQNYEIPLRLLEQDVALSRLPKEAMSALIFTNAQGERMVRWLINPEDTKWHLELEAWMKSKGVSTKRHEYFDGYMTASRSYIVQDPKTGYSFSMKVSTNVTGGNWRDKKQSWDDARQVKQGSDFIMSAMAKRNPKNFLFMDEPLVFGVKDIDQGMLLRLLADLNTKDRTYVPGFSILHEETGRSLAKINGSADPAGYWKQHFMRPLGRSIAELFAMTGFAYDSPHSQNFLVELDEKMRPTGKIVFRDLGDSYLASDMLKALGGEHLLAIWEKGNITNGISIAEGVLHGNLKPSWVPENMYEGYAQVFFEEFERELRGLTGVSAEELASDGKHYRSGDYFLKHYHFKKPGISGEFKPGWGRFLHELRRNNGLRATPPVCGQVFGRAG